MSGATILGGESSTGKSAAALDAIRARDAGSGELLRIENLHDDGTPYFAPEKDRRTLLGLVDEMTEALQEIQLILSNRESLSDAKIDAADLMRMDDLVCDALAKAGL
jgi:hypothetical protein